MMARGVPPGSMRDFAFMDWPGYDSQRWEALLAQAQARVRNKALIIQASDRDAGAVEMAKANAERAGVGEAVEFSCRALSAIEPPAGPGWVVTNPPYGLRVSEGRDLRNLYAQMGNVLRRRCPGWQAAILCSDRQLLAQTGLKLDTELVMINGGIRVWLGRGNVA